MSQEISNQVYQAAFENQDNTKIIYSALRHFHGSLDADERHECGLHGLWRALKSHDPTKGQKFTTTLYRFVQWEARRAMKNKLRDRKKADKVGVTGIPIDTYIDEDFTLSIETDDLLDQLEEKYRVIIKQKYLEGFTLNEIGQHHGFTSEAARQNVDKALVKLRKLAYN